MNRSNATWMAEGHDNLKIGFGLGLDCQMSYYIMGRPHLPQKNEAFTCNGWWIWRVSTMVLPWLICADKCTTPATKIILQGSGSAKSHAVECSWSPWECCLNSCKLICGALQVTYSSLFNPFYQAHFILSFCRNPRKRIRLIKRNISVMYTDVQDHSPPSTHAGISVRAWRAAYHNQCNANLGPAQAGTGAVETWTLQLRIVITILGPAIYR